MAQIQLGLIGDNIKASRAPNLHHFCGEMTGLDVDYQRLIPADLGTDFDTTFANALNGGYRGLNITLPYKERVVTKLTINDPDIARIGACNTVLFTEDGPKGYNTDFSGFIAGFRDTLGDIAPGRVVMFGAGGVGKAVAFGLKRLNASQIILIDPDTTKAQELADALNASHDASNNGVTLARVGTLDDLARADGVINCTPLGMVGYGGSPVPEDAFPAATWAFDAVYTPVNTPFKAQAEAAGAAFMSGYELYYWQGVDAYEIFTGVKITDHATLRAHLLKTA
ncbi:shikimate dehydrogenase family protein [Celeribacter marinus]|uniref:shikimate dehydrogenase family protein n=1 Tax=Celeribacter marinus TaxID=1397108 RepID=UPI003F6A935B